MDKLKTRGAASDLLIIVVTFALLYLGLTWMRPLANPDEGRYAEIAREMVATGDWVTPRLNGVLYFYKPPLLYWLEASAIAVGGTSLIALRFWPAALAILGIAGTYLAARRLHGRLAAQFSAGILGTTALYFALGQLIILDMAVSVFISLALFLFYLALHEEEARPRRWLFYLFYLCVALAVLSKGLMGILIPGAIIFLWFLLLNQWARLRRLHLVTGSLLFLAVALPWHVLAALHNPDWFSFYIIHEHFLRYLSDVSDRSQPFWYFFVLLPLGFIPWVVFLPQALKNAFAGGWQARQSQSAFWYYGIWVCFVLLFFSSSKSKLIPYILPVYPALAVLTGNYLAQLWRNPERFYPRRIFAALLVLCLAAAIAAPVIAIVREGKMAPGTGIWLGLLGALMLGLAIGMFLCLRQQRDRQGILLIFAGMAAFMLLFQPLAAGLQRSGTQALADYLRPHLTADCEVYTFFEFPGDFPLHLGRTVGVVGHIPNEHSYGLEWEPAMKANYPELTVIIEHWGEPRTIHGITRHDWVDHIRQGLESAGKGNLYLWHSNRQYSLFSNQPPPDQPQP